MTTERINDMTTERIDRVYEYLVDLERKLKECGDVEVGKQPRCTQACCND